MFLTGDIVKVIPKGGKLAKIVRIDDTGSPIYLVRFSKEPLKEIYLSSELEFVRSGDGIHA